MLLVTAGLVSQGMGQVVVYHLQFKEMGESINYRPYQNGYYIAPMEGGSGSLVLTQVTGNVKQYFSYEGFGELFVALKGDKQKMVLSATATSDVSTTVFYALGDGDEEFDVKGRNLRGKVKVAKKLTGYAVSADSEQDLPFYGTGASVGVAGVSELVARMDEANTNRARQENLDTAGAVDVVLGILTAAGYVDGRPQSGGGNNGGNGGNNGGGAGGGQGGGQGGQ